jgi:hypothetical protein
MKRMMTLLVLGIFSLVATQSMAKDAQAKPEVAALGAGAPKDHDSWGGRLPETLKISIWSSKDGESGASSLATSRERFSAFAMIGSDSKGGMVISVKGRILAAKDGAYEVLLDMDVKGGTKGSGGMELKLKTSALLKKGEPKILASNKDGQFFIKIQ